MSAPPTEPPDPPITPGYRAFCAYHNAAKGDIASTKDAATLWKYLRQNLRAAWEAAASANVT